MEGGWGSPLHLETPGTLASIGVKITERDSGNLCHQCQGLTMRPSVPDPMAKVCAREQTAMPEPRLSRRSSLPPDWHLCVWKVSLPPKSHDCASHVTAWISPTTKTVKAVDNGQPGTFPSFS